MYFSIKRAINARGEKQGKIEKNERLIKIKINTRRLKEEMREMREKIEVFWLVFPNFGLDPYQIKSLCE